MIRSFTVVDPAKTHIGWWDKIEAFKKPRTFEFTRGLNVLWGRNGSGKTTLIKALARLTHCEQSGSPVVTWSSMNELQRGIGDNLGPLKKAIKLSQDGQGVRYFDPSNKVGIIGGSFDDDFFEMGLRNTMFRGSSGETTLMRFNDLFGDIIEGQVPKVEIRQHRDDRLVHIKHFLKGTGKKGPPTILLDEPARSLDLPMQVKLWHIIRAYAPQVQFIVASHSLFALRIPGANYIELSAGYLDSALQCLDLLANRWPGVECKPLDPKVVEKFRKDRAARAKKR